MNENSTTSDQLGFGFAQVSQEVKWEPEADEIRQDALAILASARAVNSENLWDVRTYRYNKVVFPQMTNWLPADERDQLCFEFFQELERIETLMAA